MPDEIKAEPDTPGELLFQLVEAIGISREDFLAMPPADVVAAARTVKAQADHLAGVLDEGAKERYRGDVALATLDGLVSSIRPVIQGIETPEEKSEAGLVFSRVHQALAESRTEGDRLDPDEAIRRVGRLLRMDPPDPERSPILHDAFELIGQQVEIVLCEDDDPVSVAKGTLLGFCDGGQTVVRDEGGFVNFSWPMLSIRPVDWAAEDE